jgi:hypothetical protein
VLIAYALWKTLQQWQSRAGLGHAPRTILEEFSRILAADVVLPLVDRNKPELRSRCVVRPDREQAILLEHLASHCLRVYGLRECLKCSGDFGP